MRLGLFGGSFDPVHYGHLLLAECCREQCRLHQVWFVPAHAPPHKQRQLTDGARRAEMLELACGGQPAFGVCRLELERGGTSYSVETLERVRQLEPASELFFLLGADSLADLPNWREPARICELATLVVVARPGSAPPSFETLTGLATPERIEHFRRHVVEMPQVDFRSRVLRQRTAQGQSIRYRTPRAVEQYIHANRLYAEP